MTSFGACGFRRARGGMGILALMAAVLGPVPAVRAAESDAAALQVRITKADCLRLVPHEPAPDVEYQPGVDVRGEPVAPADLHGGSRIELPETVTIPIEVDLADRFGLPDDDSFESDVHVGTVEVHLEDGYATFNGQPLVPAAQRLLAERCQRRLDTPD